ncbi:CoA transferase subunit A [Novosphingobium sp. P6W]|uniref:CoA transferase subunit A n=1 Tax=Novosphingobium sp. P6W TaxID=1609758 RepID=UPI0005C3207D|nr:CoA-transferase [Novosphingobium sp. P6W]AXB80572.1 acyl CoA--acetate/3-ketoacid CoA transferase subunit alpha [Novosphingobium sp. P6W]KIS31621.1 CoA-transferase [Novosphingobium sp. P6W]
MLDKRMTVDDIVDQLSDGMTIGIGGWATRRKPMALIRAIARSKLKDLTIMAGYGGPDIGLLAATGKIRKLVFAFASLDHFPLEPHFRNARQAGAFEVLELDEGLYHWGLRAAAMKLPFLPSRVGIGTDIIRQSGFDFKMVKSPYEDSEELVAMPALVPDVALIHAHRSDERGNILTLSVDPLFDELLVRAAGVSFVTVEKIVSTAELEMKANSRFNLVERAMITGVAEAPFGAHPTSAAPDYQLDLKHIKAYVDSAASPEAWAEYKAKYIDVSEAEYQATIGGAEVVEALPVPVY